jgi:ATP-dependent Clp protease protease subunit
MKIRTVVALGLVSLLFVGFFNFTYTTAVAEKFTIPTSNLQASPQPSFSPSDDVIPLQKITVPSRQVIYLHGEIRENIKEVIKELKIKEKLHEELYILIDSPGGSVLDGALMLSAMEASSAHINTVCTGTCASMAFIIHQYGDTRMALNRTMLMAHPASGGVRGTLEEMQSRLSTIRRFVEKMDAAISERAGTTLPSFKSLIVSEFWVDAEDALNMGYVDEIVDINTDAPEPSLTTYTNNSNNEVKEKINLTW